MKKLEAEMFVSAPMFDRSETVCITTKLFHFLSLLIYCYNQCGSSAESSIRRKVKSNKSFFCVGIFLIIFNLQSFSKTVEVSSITDERYIAYKDSMNSYLCGLYQIEIASKIKDRNSVSEGKTAMDKINKRCKSLNPEIKSIALRRDLTFTYSASDFIIISQTQISQTTTVVKRQSNIVQWIPDVYKRPVIIVVLYKPIKKIKRILINQIPQNAIIVELIIPKKQFEELLMPNGTYMRKKDFEKRYGTKVCNYYFVKNH